MVLVVIRCGEHCLIHVEIKTRDNDFNVVNKLFLIPAVKYGSDDLLLISSPSAATFR